MRTLKNKHGWITVACCFILQALSQGLGSSMGVFYIQWEQAFPQSSAIISALATSVLATMLCTAPISGAITKKLGIRKTIVVGGCLSFSGFFLTRFVYKATVLFLTVAVMIGLGCSVLFITASVAVSNHFNKNFTTASAVSNAGASVGVLVLPILFEVLVSTYGWREACMVVSAIQLHVFVCMMLMKPPRKPSKAVSTPTVRDRIDASNLNETKEETDAATKTTTEIELTSGPTSTLEKTEGDSEERRWSGREGESQSADEILTSIDVSDVTNDWKGTDDVDVRNDENEISEETRNGEDHLADRNVMSQNDNQDEISSETGGSDKLLQMTSLHQEASDHKSQDNIQMAKQDNHFQLSLLNICLKRCLNILDLFDLRLLWTNPPFATFLISFSLGGWCQGTILPHLAARAVSAGINKLLASSLISIIGIGNLFSRCVYGWLVDSSIIHPVHLLFLAYATTALSSAIVAFSTVYSLLCIGALGIGIGVGIYIPLTQPLVRSLVGHKGFAGGFGLCLMSVGISNFLSATFAGMIYDLTGNYTYVFLLPTGVGTLASITVLVNQIVWGNWVKHPRWPTRTRRKEKKTSLDEEDGVNLELDSLNKTK